MRNAALILAFCCCYFGLVEPISAWRYHEKTRFDRSIENAPKHEAPSRHIIINKKPRIFTDGATHYTAYKDAGQSVCYLEKLKNDFDDIEVWSDIIRGNKKTLRASDRLITKFEAWRIAGSRVVDFCRGMQMILLHGAKSHHTEDPVHNELSEEETRAAHKQGLTPLKIRARHQSNGQSEQEELVMTERKKREAAASRRFRGQTQSQYLNVGSDGQNEGKAEAEATQQSSRAIVSGSSGMGQAQSMSSGADGCEGCPGYDRLGSVSVICT